jgi:hypothetical protein
LDSAGTGYVYAGDNPVNAVDPSGKFYVDVRYHYVQTWFGRIPTGIDSITLELTAADLSYGSAIVGAIVGTIVAHFGLPAPLAPVVAGIVSNAVSRAFASCPNLFLLYANFDTGTYYTQCY